MSRFVTPDVVRLELTAGDWILINRRLTLGQQRKAQAGGIKRAVIGADMEIDLERAGIANTAAYLVDWSFTGLDGQPVVIRDKPMDIVIAILQNLTPEDYDEIAAAIATHEQALAEEKKNIPDYRERIVSDLRICRRMRWTYDDVLALPVDVYTILIEELIAESEKA